jgi:hypothetical protein
MASSDITVTNRTPMTYLLTFSTHINSSTQSFTLLPWQMVTFANTQAPATVNMFMSVTNANNGTAVFDPLYPQNVVTMSNSTLFNLGATCFGVIQPFVSPSTAQFTQPGSTPDLMATVVSPGVVDIVTANKSYILAAMQQILLSEYTGARLAFGRTLRGGKTLRIPPLATTSDADLLAFMKSTCYLNSQMTFMTYYWYGNYGGNPMGSGFATGVTGIWPLLRQNYPGLVPETLRGALKEEWLWIFADDCANNMEQNNGTFVDMGQAFMQYYGGGGAAKKATESSLATVAAAAPAAAYYPPPMYTPVTGHSAAVCNGAVLSPSWGQKCYTTW